jgi:hypothetical protein
MLEQNSLFNPIGDDYTEDVQSEFNGDKLSAGRVLSRFGGPDRDDGVQYTSTPTVDETSANHPGVILSRSLKRSTNDGPPSSQSDRLDTTISITERTADETAHERTEIVDGDNPALKERVVDNRSLRDGICVAEFHDIVVVVWCRVDTTHHSLVITKEEDRQASDTIDGCEERFLLQTVDHIGSGNKIHGSDS